MLRRQLAPPVNPAQSPFAGGDNALFSVPHSLPRAMSKKKVPKKKLATLQVDRFCDRQLCRPKPLFSKYAVFFSIPTPPKSNKF